MIISKIFISSSSIHHNIIMINSRFIVRCNAVANKIIYFFPFHQLFFITSIQNILIQNSLPDIEEFTSSYFNFVNIIFISFPSAYNFDNFYSLYSFFAYSY